MAHEPTVFVVDDDPAVCASIAMLLRAAGRRAETFPSAAAFLEAYDPGHAGCLVLDLSMPGMTGLELQRRLESLRSTLTIVWLSAHGDSPLAVEATKRGLAFVRKPFRDRELLETIARAIDENARRRDAPTEGREPVESAAGADHPRGEGS